MLILTSQGHRAFKIKSTEASRIGSTICKVDIYQLLLAVTELISPTFETLEKGRDEYDKWIV